MRDSRGGLGLGTAMGPYVRELKRKRMSPLRRSARTCSKSGRQPLKSANSMSRPSIAEHADDRSTRAVVLSVKGGGLNAGSFTPSLSSVSV